MHNDIGKHPSIYIFFLIKYVIEFYIDIIYLNNTQSITTDSTILINHIMDQHITGYSGRK